MSLLTAIIAAVVANVVSHYIIKWLDHDSNDSNIQPDECTVIVKKKNPLPAPPGRGFDFTVLLVPLAAIAFAWIVYHIHN